MSRLNARELIDLVLDDGSWASWDGPVEESVLTGEGPLRGRRVAVVVSEFGLRPGSIGRVAADRLVGGGRTGDRRGAPAARGHGQRRHPDAGGHARVRADDPDLRRHRRPQGRRAAVPRLPAAPDDRRRDGVVGVARARDRGRARRPGGVPRARGSSRRFTAAVPRGRADRGEPLSRTASSTPSCRPTRSATSCDRAVEDPDVRARCRRTVAGARRGRRSPTSTHGRRSPGRADRTGPAYAGCCGTPPPT